MIRVENNIFALDTAHTSYVFRVLETGQLEHLYYGKKIHLGEHLEYADALVERHAFAVGNSINYDQEHLEFSLEDACLEISALGKGDIRDPFVDVEYANGSRTTDFCYSSYEIVKGMQTLDTLPSSYGSEEEVQTVGVTLKDDNYNVALNIYYHVYENCDVITRNAVFINESGDAVKLHRLMSAQIDFSKNEYELTTFHGAWARELDQVTEPVKRGRYVGSSVTGTSSNRTNPFFMMGEVGATENHGNCYGFNLIYSGNHYESVEQNAYGKTRVLWGINPETFTFELGEGETFESPEAVLTFSSDGYNGMSHNMHAFVRNHIVRGAWKNKVRPVLLNSWEAAYFNINESKLLKFAKAAKNVGIELFVMDDGWFGMRNDDAHSLGDWEVNLKKLPGGLKGICDKVNALGLDFGIWVEPEMVNVKSKLYEAHPDWCLAVPGKPHSEGRNQRVLDLCRSDVQDYIIESMTNVFSSANIAYVKWDMNRIFTDYFSTSLEASKQGEVAHRYVMGLYRVMGELTAKFPKILFEGCAAGGNRFDLGILCYFPQIWGSDNTDAICRANIETGYSYGYPLETVGSHVSGCPNHQTLRTTPLETRFAVASFGSLGYECNLCDMSKEDLEAVKTQIELYKELRSTMQFGTFYRGRKGDTYEWTVVNKEQTKAVGMILQTLVAPNTQFEYYRAAGLKEDALYHFTNRILKYNVKEFGDLVNTVAPIHVKQDSLIHNAIAKFVKMDGEIEDYTLYGDTLMNAGVKLKQGFGGTGYSDQVRFYQDFAARVYFMETK